MDRCTGHIDVSEILMKIALKPYNQSIIQSRDAFSGGKRNDGNQDFLFLDSIFRSFVPHCHQ